MGPPGSYSEKDSPSKINPHQRGGLSDADIAHRHLREGISGAYLLPVIRQLLDGFSFAILGLHSNNGSEHINYKVAKLLEKLLVEYTKLRPRHSNDNALAESKNVIGGA